MRVKLRNVQSSDIKYVYELSNEDYVRKYSINKNKIDWSTHVKWFENMINSTDNYFYVVTNEKNDFLGQIRFTIESCSATVSISFTKEILGQGLSKNLLRQSITKLKEENPKIEQIIAIVSKNNLPSQELFEKALFERVKEDGNLLTYIYKY